MGNLAILLAVIVVIIIILTLVTCKKGKITDAPFSKGYLQAGIHKIYWEQYGNPKGIPILIFHGGPGGCMDKTLPRLFNLMKYRIILFDQRGCGQSIPRNCIEENTTWDLIADAEKLRIYLSNYDASTCVYTYPQCSIDQWIVCGMSWGASLALLYAEMYPQNTIGIIVGCVFLSRPPEVDWLLQSDVGAGSLYPSEWKKFKDFILKRYPSQSHNLIKAYNNLLITGSAQDKQDAARTWDDWESVCAGGAKDNYNADDAYTTALMESYYFTNNGFFPTTNYILENISIIRSNGIPGIIIQGSDDTICPMNTATDLSVAWPEATYIIVDGEGHTSQILLDPRFVAMINSNA